MSSSLFIVSLPRSMSSLVHSWCVHLLGFREPAWTTDGEILNLDRFALHGGARMDESHKFTRHRESRYPQVLEMLDQLCQPRGFVYKDVVQPFVVAQWLAAKHWPVLRIERRLADVVFAMMRRRWFYPSSGAATLAGLVDGLIESRKQLRRIPAQAVDYDDLIQSPSTLYEALARLYPSLELWRLPLGHRDPNFVARRDAALQHRLHPTYRRIERVVDEVLGRHPHPEGHDEVPTSAAVAARGTTCLEGPYPAPDTSGA